MRPGFIFSEMGTGIRRNVTMSIALVLTVAVALAGVGVAALMRQQINTMKDFWYGKIEVSVFLTKDVTQPERDAIRNELTSLPQVEHVYYESQQQAWQRFQQQFKNQKALVENTDPKSLPESYRVKLHDPKKYAIVASAVANMPGVDQVAEASQALKRIFQFFDTIQRDALFAAGVLFIVAILLIFNTVRLAAFSRRRETGIMRLVGASNLVIQIPFILESLISAVIGAVLASAILLSFTQFAVQGWLAGTLRFIRNWVGLSDAALVLPAMFLVGIGIAGVSAFLSLRRYLKV
jgi:cell division transport system permease protein